MTELLTTFPPTPCSKRPFESRNWPIRLPNAPRADDGGTLGFPPNRFFPEVKFAGPANLRRPILRRRNREERVPMPNRRRPSCWNQVQAASATERENQLFGMSGRVWATKRFTVISTASIVLNNCTATFDTGSFWLDDEPKYRSDGRIVMRRDCEATSQFHEARSPIKSSTPGRHVIRQSREAHLGTHRAGIIRPLPRSILCPT